MLCGRLFRHTEDTGTFSSYLNHPGFYCKFTMTGFMYQMPVIFRKRSTLASPAFKSRSQCHIFCGIGILCAVAYAIVAKACSCTEYSGSGTKPSVLTQTKDNWKLFYVHGFHHVQKVSL